MPETTISQPPNELILSAIIPAIKAAINCFKLGYRYTPDSNKFDYPVEEIFTENKYEIKGVDLTDYEKLSHPRSFLKFLSFDSVLINTVAFEYVLKGKSALLDTLPVAEFNKIKTYDKEEIADYRSFRKLVAEYLEWHENTTPLSIAVFGPPGSGKSFGVKQIGGLFGKKNIYC